MKLILLLLLVSITPLSSAFGYEYYEIDTDYLLENDPTVCYNAFEKSERFETIVKQSINTWESNLKEHTKNYEAWNIYYEFYDRDDLPIEELEFIPCNIFVIFVYDVDEGFSGTTELLTTNQTLIQISTDFDFSDDEFFAVLQHELGHAFGLGHYTTTDNKLMAEWMQGIDVPSMMTEIPPPYTQDKITELDLKKMVSLYGYDGFGESKSFPDWIQTIIKWNEEGAIEDLELNNAIDYLVQNGIIQIVCYMKN